ncbi:MAG: hypothetical protein ABEH47_05035 [Haloferacaceae archaeon]
MRVETGDRTFEGRAVDLSGTVDPSAVVKAVRGETEDGLVVECPPPGPVHRRVGHVHAGMAVDLRGALAAAARSLGERAPQRDDLRTARSELADLSVPDADLDEVRRRVAEAGASEERLRERVAALRGRVRALEGTAEESEARAALRDAVRELTEAETERIAAEQLRDRLEREARDLRDRRERRLELEDRVANLEREARAHLAGAVYDRFRAAVEALPGDATVGDDPGAYDGDPVTAALGVVRVADVDAPIVLAVDRFEDAESAARRLDAPVIRP